MKIDGQNRGRIENTNYINFRLFTPKMKFFLWRSNMERQTMTLRCRVKKGFYTAKIRNLAAMLI